MNSSNESAYPEPSRHETNRRFWGIVAPEETRGESKELPSTFYETYFGEMLLGQIQGFEDPKNGITVIEIVAATPTDAGETITIHCKDDRGGLHVYTLNARDGTTIYAQVIAPPTE